MRRDLFDPVLEEAARALAVGDPIEALQRVALRNDAAGLALRGIAMAQLGDLQRAKELLKGASRAFGPKDHVARARCLVAEAEIALVPRDLGFSPEALERARGTLEREGDRLNAAHARHLQVRRALLTGRLAEAERMLGDLDPTRFPPTWRAAYELAAAGISVRRLRIKAARAALTRAKEAAFRSGINALVAEADAAFRVLDSPAARLMSRRIERLVSLDEVEDVLLSGALVVDACRYAIREATTAVSMAGRPVLFELARALGEAWPDDVSRETLCRRAFELELEDFDDRQRLRVEIGRLRKQISPLGEVMATRRGFALVPHRATDVAVLAPPADVAHAAVLGLLGDGESWSSSGLSLALGVAQRTVQRALEALASEGKVQPVGEGRARRWMTPLVIGFTTTLLLPGFSEG